MSAVLVAHGFNCVQLLLQLRRKAEVAGLREVVGHWQRKSKHTEMRDTDRRFSILLSGPYGVWFCGLGCSWIMAERTGLRVTRLWNVRLVLAQATRRLHFLRVDCRTRLVTRSPNSAWAVLGYDNPPYRAPVSRANPPNSPPRGGRVCRRSAVHAALQTGGKQRRHTF